MDDFEQYCWAIQGLLPINLHGDDLSGISPG